jgi:hypothetical protein
MYHSDSSCTRALSSFVLRVEGDCALKTITDREIWCSSFVHVSYTALYPLPYRKPCTLVCLYRCEVPCSLLSAEFGRAAARRRRETACHSEHFRLLVVLGVVSSPYAYLPHAIGSDAAMCRVLDRGRTFYIAGRTDYADVLGRYARCS